MDRVMRLEALTEGSGEMWTFLICLAIAIALLYGWVRGSAVASTIISLCIVPFVLLTPERTSHTWDMFAYGLMIAWAPIIIRKMFFGPNGEPPSLWMLFQYAVSVVAGALAITYAGSHDPDNHGNLLFGFFAGLIAARAVMFLIVWARFGWASARSMSMS